MAFIYNPALSVWVITKSNSSENPRGFNIKFEMYGKSNDKFKYFALGAFIYIILKILNIITQ